MVERGFLRAMFAFASVISGVVSTGSDEDGIHLRQPCHAGGNQSVYDFMLRNVYDNATFAMSQFRGKLTLVINVAVY